MQINSTATASSIWQRLEDARNRREAASFEQHVENEPDIEPTIQPAEDDAPSFRESVLTFAMRRKMPLMATGLMTPKTQAEFDALGLGEEWLRKKSQWEAKVGGLTPAEREAAGVSLPEETEEIPPQGDAQPPTQNGQEGTHGGADPIALRISSVGPGPQDTGHTETASVAQTITTKQDTAPAAQAPKDDASSFRDSVLTFAMRRKMPLMATGLMTPKTQAEFDALGLGEEWLRKKSQWEAKISAMSVPDREAAGVSLPDDKSDVAAGR